MRQSLDNRTQDLEVDTSLSHSKRDLWRPSREEAYLSHIWWRRSKGQYCNIGPRRRASLHFGSEKWGKFCALTPRVRSALYHLLRLLRICCRPIGPIQHVSTVDNILTDIARASRGPCIRQARASC